MIRVLAMLLFFAAPLAQAESGADRLAMTGIVEFTNAYQTWDGQRFIRAVELFQRACTNASASATDYYWLGAAEFHRMLQLQGMPESAANKAAAAAALDAAVDALKKGEKLDEHQAEIHALLGTLYGMKIGGNFLRAMSLGPQAQSESKLALAEGASNPRVQYLLGMSQFHMAMRTASKREALTNLLAAQKLFEAERLVPAKPLEPRWGYDSCLTFIGLSYEKLGQPETAAEYFLKALAIHPKDGLAQEGLKRLGKTGGK